MINLDDVEEEGGYALPQCPDDPGDHHSLRRSKGEATRGKDETQDEQQGDPHGA